MKIMFILLLVASPFLCFGQWTMSEFSSNESILKIEFQETAKGYIITNTKVYGTEEGVGALEIVLTDNSATRFRDVAVRNDSIYVLGVNFDANHSKLFFLKIEGRLGG